MYRIKYCLLVIYILTICISCSQQSRKAKVLFDQAEALLESHPDSALMLLDSMADPESLNKKMYNEYYLLNIQVKDKNFIDIKEDTFIYDVARYFESKNDKTKAAIALFYTGRIKYQNDKTTEAIEHLLHAKEYAEDVSNHNLLGLIHFDTGNIYRHQGKYTKFIEQLLLAKNYFVQSKNKKNEIYTLGFIGDAYLFTEPPQIDSTIFYNTKALEYARKIKDTLNIEGALRNIAIAYQQKRDYEKAKQYINQAIEMDQKQSQFINYRTKVRMLIDMNQTDSAIYYMKKIDPKVRYSNDLVSRYTYYRLFYSIYKNKGNYDLALKNYEEVSILKDSIYAKNRAEDLETMQRKYEKSQLQNKYIRTRVQQQFLIMALLAAILVIILLIWMIHTMRRNKNRKIKEIEQNILTLENIQKDKENKMKQYLVEKLDITRKLIYLQTTDPKKTSLVIKNYQELFNSKLDKHLEWDELYSLINELYNGFVDRLKRKYPDLDEKELQICCLVYAEFKNDEIAFFTGYAKTSLRTIKSGLKEKLNLKTVEDIKNL